MITEEQKKLLIEAIEQEAKTISEYSSFGTNNHKEQYEYVLKFLREGELYVNAPEEWKIYWAAVEDLEGLIDDYL